MQHSFIVEYVHKAYDENLVQSGEYVFIGFQMDINMNYHDVPLKWYFSTRHGVKDQKDRMEAFASVLIMEVRRVDTPQYHKFKEDIKHLSRIPPFNSSRYHGCAQFVRGVCMFWKNNSVVSNDCFVQISFLCYNNNLFRIPTSPKCFSVGSCRNYVQYNTIQYNTIQYNAIRYNTMRYNTIRYDTISFFQCSFLQLVSLEKSWILVENRCF